MLRALTEQLNLTKPIIWYRSLMSLQTTSLRNVAEDVNIWITNKWVLLQIAFDKEHVK